MGKFYRVLTVADIIVIVMAAPDITIGLPVSMSLKKEIDQCVYS